MALVIGHGGGVNSKATIEAKVKKRSRLAETTNSTSAGVVTHKAGPIEVTFSGRIFYDDSTTPEASNFDAGDTVTFAATVGGSSKVYTITGIVEELEVGWNNQNGMVEYTVAGWGNAIPSDP